MHFIEPAYITEWKPKILSPSDWKSFRGLDEVCASVLDQIGEHLGRADSRERCEQAVWAFIGTLHECYKQERPMGLPLRKQAYKASKRYNPKWFAYRPIKKVYDLLVAYGWIEAWKGYPGFGDGGFITKVYCSEKLEGLFEINSPISSTCNMHELIHLKDGDKRLMEYDDTAYTLQKRGLVEEYNTYMEGFQIMHAGRRLNTNLFSVHSRGSFDLNGRYHNSAGGAQALNAEERGEILFSHPLWGVPEPAREFDFDSLHPNLIYRLEGIEHGLRDLYLPVCRKIDCSDAIRPAVKLMTFTLVNAKDETSAIRAFHKRVNDARRGKRTKKKLKLVALWEAMQAEGITSKQLVEAIKSVHSAIAHWFGSDAGIKLMWHDSEIMTLIIKECLAVNIPALPIHDSIVVPASRYEEAKAIALNALDEHMNSCQSSSNIYPSHSNGYQG